MRVIISIKKGFIHRQLSIENITTEYWKFYSNIFLVILGISSGLSGYSMYFAQSSEVTLAISAIFIGLGSISINVILSVVVDLFPTSLR